MAVNAAFFICGLIYASWAARVPTLQADRSLSESQLGLVLLCIALGALVAMPLAGYVVSKYGSRKITRITFLLLPIAALGIGFSPDMWTAAAAFFIVGMINGSLDVAMNAQAVLVEEAYERPIMASFHAVFSAGMIVGSLLGSLGAREDWTLVFQLALAGILSLALAPLALPKLFPDEHLASQAQAGGGHGMRLPVPAVWALGFIAFCGMTGEGSMADWSTKYMLDIVKTPEARAALALTTFSVMMTTGRVFGDRVRAAWGDRTLLIRASLVAFSGLGITLLLPHPVLSIIGVGLVGLALSIVVPIVFSLASKVPNLGTGVGISMVSTIGYAGFLLGPAIIGFLSDLSTLRWALGFVLILFAVMTIISRQIKPSLSDRSVAQAESTVEVR